MHKGRFAAAPPIDTARLSLRGHTVEDYEESAAMWADPEVVRHISGRPSTREESWSRLLRYAGLWAALGFGYWVVREKASGRFVGEVGFAEFHRDIDPPLCGPEAGWVLASWCHGRGYATEAVRAAIEWADAHLDGRCTTCIIVPEHAASIHVAGKCGYREIARTAYRGEPVISFERHRR